MQKWIMIGISAAMALVLGAAGTADAGPTSTQKCAASKMKAASKKAAARLGCYSKASKKDQAVDPGCLAKEAAKLEASYGKAEGKGGCSTSGDSADIATIVDDGVAAIIVAIPTTGGKCAATVTGLH